MKFCSSEPVKCFFKCLKMNTLSYRLILTQYIFPGFHELRLKGALMNLIKKKYVIPASNNFKPLNHLYARLILSWF